MVKRLFKVCLCLSLILSLFCVDVFAAKSDTYAHNNMQGGKVVSYYSKEMFNPVKSINADSIGLQSELDGMTDISVDNEENIYILCGDSSRLIVLNSDYSLKHELSIHSEAGESIDYTGAKGIYISKDNKIYIADTNNGRILVCNMDGLIIKTMEKPKSSLIPKSFTYNPTKIIIDNRGYTYILSLGSYYGALTFSPDGEFIGFFGSNTVNANALDTLAFLWDKLTGTDAKRKLSSKTLPYSFVDFCLDSDGYMLTCSIDEDMHKTGKGQIRKITYNGSNILYKRENNDLTITSENVNFLENKPYKYQGKDFGQRLCAINVDKYGFIYALDETYGLIYVLDSNCNVINIFGGGYKLGNQLGTYNIPTTFAVKGDSLLVADSGKLSITIYNITEYGDLLRKAQSLYLKGKYIDATPYWEKVISMDRGCQLAYRGLAMSSYYKKDYKTAVEYAKSGSDYSVYDNARQQIILDKLSKNFIWTFPVILAIIAILIICIVKFKKRKVVLKKDSKILMPFRAVFHPFDTFNDIKQNNKGSWVISFIITILLYVAFTCKATLSGFLFNKTSPASYNMIYTLLQTIGLLFLWSISNWLICTLFSGKGSFKDVYISTTYSLIPLIVYTFLYTILSHFLSVSAMSVLDGIQIVIWIYTFFLITVAMITVHEFYFFKFILTSLVVIFFMIIIAFVAFMFIMLISEVTHFGTDIYEELIFR